MYKRQALHHRQELLALYVHEATRQGISRHRLDVAAFNRTIGLSRLRQGLIYFFIKGEGFSLHLQDTVFHAHLSSNHYLRRVGILRRAKGCLLYTSNDASPLLLRFGHHDICHDARIVVVEVTNRLISQNEVCLLYTSA